MTHTVPVLSLQGFTRRNITIRTWFSDHHRGLVVQAFARRQQWHVIVVDGFGEEPCQASTSSILHWGEYERIDWQLIHEGSTTLTQAHAFISSLHACMGVHWPCKSQLQNWQEPSQPQH